MDKIALSKKKNITLKRTSAQRSDSESRLLRMSQNRDKAEGVRDT